MTVRIPSRVNRALDVLSLPQHVPAAAVASVLAAASVTLTWVSPVAAAATAGVLLAFLAAAGHILRVAAWKERAAQAESDLRIAHHDLAELQAGDPSAPTMKLRSIGEAGERL